MHVRIERVESGEQVDLDGSAAGSLAASVEEAIRAASRALGDGDGAADPGGPTGRAEPVGQRASVGGVGDGQPVPGEPGCGPFASR